ncbi:MAG: MBL fold metallo-hydrolase [Rhodospirillales bacterium]|nr:MBL fold metallo-hydrolase [Rhodospirillales bacterium]
MGTLSIGAILVRRIVELEGPFLDPTEICAEATPENLAPHMDWLSPRALCPDTGKLIFSFHSWLVQSTRHTILIDTCVGCDKTVEWHAPWHQRQDRAWLSRLAMEGVQPEQVDYVFCTHLHLDHTGWNTRLLDGRWVPTFPNAKYIMARDDYEDSQINDNLVYRENILPVMEAGQGVLVDTDFQLDDEIWLESTPGHTKGHVAVHLASQGHHAVLCGDLMHTPVQCAHPEWSAVFDWDLEMARTTRRRFLENRCADGQLVLTAHFPTPSLGYIEAKDDTFRFRYRGE